jgi:hypothetical protein
MAAPAHPNIYHITHVSNLPGIIAKGGLRSDTLMIAAGGPAQTIGMSSIKSRRLHLPVRCHQGDMVGQYVPFYFCSRSIMLYLLHKGNHPEVDYKGGQTPIVHLEADLGAAVAWAQANGRRWAFSLSNAGASYAEFRDNLSALGEVRWDAVAATQWSAPDVKEGKQAEFLMRDDFPWGLFTRIGVHTMPMKLQVDAIVNAAAHKPKVDLLPGWYY